MRLSWFQRGSLWFLVLCLNSRVFAGEFVNFLAKQKIGQEITVAGGFRRFDYKKHFFHRNDKTGEVKNFDYFGITMVPTMIIGNGILSLQANVIDAMLLLYEDQELVKDLPEQGKDMWFTGTLIGFQYGVSGMITSPFSGGDPYLLLNRISAIAPPDVSPHEKKAQMLGP